MPTAPTSATARTLRAWTAALLVVTAALFAIGATIEHHTHHAETTGEPATAHPGAEAGHPDEAAETGHNNEPSQPATTRTPATLARSAQPTPTTRRAPQPGEHHESGTHSEQGEHHNEATHHEQPTTTRRATTAIGAAAAVPSSQPPTRPPTPITFLAAGPAGSQPASHIETGHERGETRPLGLNLEAPLLVAATMLASLLLATAVVWRPYRVVLAVTLGFALAAGLLDLVETRSQATSGQATLAVLAASIALLHLAVAGLAAATIRRSRPTAHP